MTESANSFPNPSLDRRGLLRGGVLVVSMGALASACGTGRSGSSEPGLIGAAPPLQTLPPGEITDVVMLRTAQSLEHTALDVLAAVADGGALSSAEAQLAAQFADEHTAHSTALGELITAAGGEQFACANPFLVARAVTPALAALDGTDDLHRDLVNLTYSFETLLAHSAQSLIPTIVDLDLRAEVMRIGGEEHRHSAVFAATVNPDELVSPALLGGQVEPDDDGFAIPYAIPSTFGQISNIELIVGAPDEEGARFTVLLNTPAANSYVYDYQSC